MKIENFKKIKNKNLLDISFETGLVLKGVFAIGEVLGGISLLFLSPERMNKIIWFFSKEELREDPNDFLLNHIIQFGHTFTTASQSFAIIYLLSHGLIKLIILTLLWKRRLWAYPLSIVVFLGFIIYQMNRFMTTHSGLLLFLTIVDLIMIILIILEYRKQKKLL